MTTASLGPGVFYLAALVLFTIEALRPGKFALWLGFAAVLCAVLASVARWPWPAELAAFALFAIALVPAFRRYERRSGTPPA